VQEVVAAIVVLLALSYVAWRLVRFVRRKGTPDCRCCQSCSAEGPEKALVTLGDCSTTCGAGVPPAQAARGAGRMPALQGRMAIPDDPGRRGVVGVVVRNGRMLVIRRSRSVVAPLVYCFPGGGIEAGESEEEALVREFLEELGVTIRPLRRLWQCTTAWKVDLAWWLVELPHDAIPTPNPLEVESIHWHTPEEMAGLPDLLESNREFLALLARGEITSLSPPQS
jgi:8-oxo-dGTP diphosphatase